MPKANYPRLQSQSQPITMEMNKMWPNMKGTKILLKVS